MIWLGETEALPDAQEQEQHLRLKQFCHFLGSGLAARYAGHELPKLPRFDR